MIPKPKKDVTSKEEKTDQYPHKYKCQNPQQNIKPSPIIKRIMYHDSVFSKNESLIEHCKISQCNLPYQQEKETNLTVT